MILETAPPDGPAWWLPIAAFLAAVILIGAAVAVVFKVLGWTDRIMRWIHQTIATVDALPARLDAQDAIIAELRPNGGKSVKDQVDRMDARQQEMDARQQEIARIAVSLHESLLAHLTESAMQIRRIDELERDARADD